MYFQLMLPGVRDGEELVLMVDGQRHKVMKHTPETLNKAREKNAALALMTEDRLRDVMYYAEVRKEGLGNGDGFDRRLHRLQVVSASRDGNGYTLPKMYHFSFYIPACHKERFLKHEALNQAGSGAYWDAKMSLYGADHAEACIRLGGQGLEESQVMEQISRINRDIDLVLTPMDIAKSLLFQHPNLANAQPYTATVVMNRHIAPPVAYDRVQYQKLLDFATAIGAKGEEGWAFRTYAWDEKKKEAMTYEYDVLGHKAGDKVEIYDLDEDVLKEAGAPLKGALKTASQDRSLQNQSWHLKHGQGAQCQEYKTRQWMDQKKAMAAPETGKGAKWTVSQSASMCGVEVKEKTCLLYTSRCV